MKEWFYRKYKAFLTWFGDIYFATQPPSVRACNLRTAMNVVQPGDVICRGYNYYLDSYFIPGAYSHSGLVISKDNMVHSVAEGVSQIDLIDFIKDCDAFIIIRPELNERDINSTLSRAFEHLTRRTQYDFIFKDPNNFYCHEFTADCLNYGGIEILPTDKEFGIWPFKFKRTLFLAQNLIDACKIIYEFRLERRRRI